MSGIRAAEGYINENGGWGGRSVQLVSCISPGDPASDLKCYHQFIQSGSIAVMGLLQNSAAYLPLLASAHIPSFLLASTLAEEESPWSMSLPSSIETATATARYACAKGMKTVAVLQQDLPQARDSENAFAAGIYKACGITVNNVYIAEGTADPAPYIQQAVKGNPDLLFLAALTSPITTLLNAVTSAGYPINKVITVPNSTSGWLSSPEAKGLLILSRSGWPAAQSTDPDIQTFLKYMAKYSAGADPSTALALPAFQEVLMIWQTGKAVGFDKFSGQTVYNYLNNVAPGHLKVFAGYGDVAIPAGVLGMKNPYQRVLRWTGTSFTDEGWWGSDWGCTSPSSCASLTLPAGSKP